MNDGVGVSVVVGVSVMESGWELPIPPETRQPHFFLRLSFGPQQQPSPPRALPPKRISGAVVLFSVGTAVFFTVSPSSGMGNNVNWFRGVFLLALALCHYVFK